MMDTAYARNLMVERQLQRRGVRDSYVLEAMRDVPREVFVPENLQEFAYEDSPLPIESGQTISQPYIVGYMLEAADLHPGDRVLEIGAGSGYAAAVMSRIVGRVFAVERHEDLTRRARERFERLGYDNIELKTGDGTNGWAEEAPFDAILVAAGGPSIPQVLMEQLDIGGRLVIPVGGEERNQRLVKVTRTSATHWDEEDLGGVQFVPLIGEYGWGEQG
ncbi:MAG: protein-L-isoaspartate(D-aspartate) O-methyltransferase, partial [Ignavibacteriales bacterium]